MVNEVIRPNKTLTPKAQRASFFERTDVQGEQHALTPKGESMEALHPRPSQALSYMYPL